MFRNVGNCLPFYSAWHPRRLKLQKGRCEKIRARSVPEILNLASENHSWFQYIFPSICYPLYFPAVSTYVEIWKIIYFKSFDIPIFQITIYYMKSGHKLRCTVIWLSERRERVKRAVFKGNRNKRDLGKEQCWPSEHKYSRSLSLRSRLVVLRHPVKPGRGIALATFLYLAVADKWLGLLQETKNWEQ
jgi:hypothetical protein